MASDYQQHQTPRQSITAYSIHSPEEDLGIAIKIDIMKVTSTSIQNVTNLKIHGQADNHAEYTMKQITYIKTKPYN